MDSSLHLLRYRQSPSDISSNNSSINVAPEKFAHWALLYEDQTLPIQMVLHIKKVDGKGKFEFFSFSPSNRLLSKEQIGYTQHSLKEAMKTCVEVTETFDFNLLNHNCQNWTTEVLDRLSLVNGSF